MTSWQRRGRVVAAAVALGVAASAFWLTTARRSPPPPPPVTTLEPTATARVTGGDVEQTRGTRRDFALQFKEQVTYTDRRTVAKDVTVTVERPAGRTFVITAKEGTVGAEQSSVDMAGDVVLRSADGLVVQSSTASYSTGEGILRSPGPVSFERGKSRGSGVGMTYEKQRDTLAVLDKAVAHIAGADAVGDMDLSAGAFSEARRDRYMRLERQATVRRPGQTFSSDEMMVFLLADRDEPDAVELRGHGRITGGTGFGALRSMGANNINVDYADDGRTVQHMTLAGEASITLAGATATATGQQLVAEFIDLSLGPDGAITNLVARDRLQVTLPSSGATPARTIRGDELSGDGAAGAGLTAMRFTGGVEFREGSSGAATRRATAQTLTLALAASGVAERATFSGETTFEDGTLTATASEARYFMADDRLVLLGRPGAGPAVTDTGLRVEATEIAIALATNALSASGAVSSVMQPATARTGKGEARTPALLADDVPLYASAGAFEYDSEARRAIYTGRARLWQGATDIRAETVTLDEAAGSLAASGGVTSTLSLESGTAGADASRGTIARAGALRYDDVARTATYTNNAQMSGPEGDLKAETIVLQLAAAARRLERIDGSGAVNARVASREARAARLVYHAADERYVFTGAPVRFTEECRVTTARTLTFFGTAGKLIVDGNDRTRAVTTGGGRCAPPPP